MCATRTKSDLPQYFYIPPNATTRNYYVCLTPPKALHHVIGRQKYRQSTGTADLRKAKPIGARLIAEKLAAWEQLLATSSPLRPAAKTLTSRTVECWRRPKTDPRGMRRKSWTGLCLKSEALSVFQGTE